MDSRRKFVQQVAAGLAGSLVTHAAPERLRVGMIGVGDRGTELLHQARSLSNVEITAFADVVPGRLDRAKSTIPSAAIYADWRHVLDDKSIHAVILATPQHLHADQFIAALDAGKHVYLEKTSALTVDQAKRMRTAHKKNGGKSKVQVGHQVCSYGQLGDVRMMLSDSSRMGKLTALTMQNHRNTPSNKPQWARPALLTADLTPDTVRWNDFLGEAPARDFDANRLIHWRYFWDYSGGSVFELMSQQLVFWYKALDLKIPVAATMDGGVFLWKDGREVPDTVNVSLQQPEDLLVTWNSGMGNSHAGVSETLLGTHGTIERASQIRYVPQKMNRPEGTEMIGKAAHAPNAHVADFFDAIRNDHETACGFELSYRVSIACRMAIESYHQWRTVRWDAEREEIV